MFKNKLAYLLFCAIFWVAQYSFGQNSQKLLDDIITNTRFNPEKTKEDAKKLLSIAKERKSYDTITLAYLYLAKAGRIDGTFKQAIEYADLGIDFANKNNVSKAILAELYLAKSNNYADAGNAVEAGKLMFKGVEIAEKSEDLKAIAILNHGLGYTYFASKDYDKAIKILKENIALIENNKLLDKKSFETYYKGMIMISYSYNAKKERDSSLFYLNKGLKHVLTTDDIFTTSGFYRLIGENYLANKEYDKAFENLKKSKELGKTIDNIVTQTETKFAIAEYYYEIGEYPKSVKELETIITNFKQKSIEEKVPVHIYRLLAKNHKKLKNFEKANEYNEKYVLGYQKNQVENKDLVNIVKDNELSKIVAQEKEKQQKTTSYIVLGCIFIIGFLLVYLFSLSKKRKKEQQNFETLLSKVSSSKKTKETKIVDTKEELKENKLSDITEETTQQILSGLQKLEEQEYYLKQECNSYNVAKKIKTNTSYLSKVINAKFDKNFNTYINDLRINYALIKLKEDTRFRSYSIKSIAEELGYKSADSFSKYFKFRTGLQPSVYIKKLNKLA